MKGFAALVMRGPVSAAAVAAATLLLGLFLPPFAWLSAAVIALVTLRLGAVAALRVALPSLAGLLLAGLAVLGQGGALALSGAAAWLPAVALALVLRQRVRLDDTLLVACGLGWAIVLATYVLVDDPTALWQDVLLQLFRPEEMSAQLEVPAEALRRMAEQLAPLMTGLIAMSVVVSAVTSLLLARWWQALLYNPGGFGAEFRALRLGRAAAVIALGLGALAVATPAPLIDGLALVALGVYVFQGLAVAHGVVKARGAGPIWLAALYIAMLPLMPYVVVGLVVLGAADAWADYRRRAMPGGAE